MSFHDLPTDWASRSLADPLLAADVLDLLVSDTDRRRGGLTVLVTDDGGRLVQPMFFEVEHPVSPTDRQKADTNLGWVVAQLDDLDPGVVVAVVRESGAFVTDDDRAWHESVLTACRAHRVPLLGMYLVTRHVVRPLPVSVSGRLRA